MGVVDFDDCFDELARVAYRVAFRILGSRTDAEDVAQEALARLRPLEEGARSRAGMGVARRRQPRHRGLAAAPATTDTATWDHK
jgi:hypothetical protein